MGRLDGIIRLKKWELDAKRRELTELQEQQAQIQANLDALADELKEQSSAAPEMAAVSLGAYLDGYRLREKALQKAFVEKEDEIQAQLDIVRDAYNELKTFEVAEEREQEEAKRKQSKIEQDAFDEIALRKHSE